MASFNSFSGSAVVPVSLLTLGVVSLLLTVDSVVVFELVFEAASVVDDVAVAFASVFREGAAAEVFVVVVVSFVGFDVAGVVAA